MDPDIRIKKLRYPDPALTGLTFYYPNLDSVSLDICIFGSDPDRNQIPDKSFRSD